MLEWSNIAQSRNVMVHQRGAVPGLNGGAGVGSLLIAVRRAGWGAASRRSSAWSDERAAIWRQVPTASKSSLNSDAVYPLMSALMSLYELRSRWNHPRLADIM